MAAPTPSARVAPGGKPMGDGYKTLVTFASDTDIEFFEKTVTPPGLESEDGPDTSTMHNIKWRTKHQRRLITMTEFTMTALYDPLLYGSILAIFGRNDTITVRWPDGSTLAFYGYLKTFKPDALEEGKVPMATITVTPTNLDPNTCTEEAPVFTEGTGTGPC